MLTRYFDAAMEQAVYKRLGDGTWFGEIPEFAGLWANEDTQEGCQEDLRSALEDWVLLALRQNVPLPVVEGIDLNVSSVA
jgi:predicted RNase H-like HicB family nuclease